MSQANQQMQALLDQALHSDCTRQRHALSSIGYRAQMAGTKPLSFLRDYFFAQFQEAAATSIATPTSIGIGPSASIPDPEPATIQCRSCGKSFATQTALNGHGEARCFARKTSPTQQ